MGLSFPVTASVARVCEHIRDAILKGQYPAGSWIRELMVAREAEVSRTTVRQALNALAAEGYVELHPNRGAMVVEWSIERLMQVFEVRAMLEGYGCELAAVHRSDDDVDCLQADADRFSELVERRGGHDSRQIAELNNAFHTRILAAARNPSLTSLLAAVVQVPLVTQTFSRYDEAALRRSAQQHQDLVQAIRRRDRDWAHATMRSHILAARQVLQDHPTH
jgi:DNA-binding GntR family transcriptional regulator